MNSIPLVRIGTRAMTFLRTPYCWPGKSHSPLESSMQCHQPAGPTPRPCSPELGPWDLPLPSCPPARLAGPPVRAPPMTHASQVLQDGGYKEPWGLRSSTCSQGTLYLSTFHPWSIPHAHECAFGRSDASKGRPVGLSPHAPLPHPTPGLV